MTKDLIFIKTKFTRTVFYALTDGFLISLSLYLSFLFRFDGDVGGKYTDMFPYYLLFFLATKYIVFSACRLYRMSWSYVGFYELVSIIKANFISLAVLMASVTLIWSGNLFQSFPRSVILTDFIITLMFISGFRLSKRYFNQIVKNKKPVKSIRTLIIGAGDSGEQLVRAMRVDNSQLYTPVGFIDDAPIKKGDYLQGVKVYGSRDDIIRITGKLEAELILLAIPSASSHDIRDILIKARKSSAKEVKTITGLSNNTNKSYSLSDITDIKIEDIIGREQASVNHEYITDFISGKKVLITGAGGSIGSELVRQVLKFNPGQIIVLDIDETELHNLEIELNSSTNENIRTVLADITDRSKIDAIFMKYRPDLVFHAAAYKHVFMMEKYPEEAVRVNIMGTRIVAETAVNYNVQKFILVSTDKAVRPTNIMGATKRVAEKIINALNSHEGTSFISVRFGNVVGSRGSVIPIFEEQIRNGGPVTVTHQEMRRYFMSIPEACTLIMQAAAMGSGGEVFLLDMGDQVKILDIAKEMIRLSGYEPGVDIPIVFTGAKPGEKLYEELLADTENAESTAHPKIFMGKNSSVTNRKILEKVGLFEEIITAHKWAWIRNLLMDFVPSYNPSLDAECNAEDYYSDKEVPLRTPIYPAHESADRGVCSGVEAI